MGKKFINSKFFLVGFFFVALITSILIFMGHPINADEGAVLNVSWQLWNHRTIYTPEFIEYVTPGSGYLIFYLWKILGSTGYVSAKLLSISLWFFSLLGFFFLIGELKVRDKIKAVYFLAVIWFLIFFLIFPLINYNSFSAFAAVWLLFLLVRALRFPKQRFTLMVVSGLLTGIIFWFLQTKGIFLFLASVTSIFFLMEDKLKTKLLHCLLYFFSFAFCLFLLFLPVDKREAFYYLFVYPYQANYFNHTFRDVYVMILEIAAIGYLFYLARRGGGKTISLLLIFQGSLYLSSVNNIDLSHFAFNSFPVFLLLIANVFNAEPNRKKNISAINIFQFQFLAISICFMTVIVISNIIQPNMFRWKSPGLFTSPVVTEARNIYGGPFMPGIYFELNKKNELSFVQFAALCDIDCQDRTVKKFREVKPEIVFLNYKLVEKLNYNKNTPIDDYINDNYKFCYMHQRVEVRALDVCPVLK